MKIFSILSRYISRSFFLNFGVVVLCLFTIIVLFDFAELQRRAGSKNISFALKLNMVLLRAPHFLEQVLPFLIFAAALFTFWKLNRSNELLVFRASGISIWRLILPLYFTALMIGLVDLTAFNPLSSAMQARFEKLEKRIFSKAHEEIKVSSTGLWLSEKMGRNQAIYRASKIDLNRLEFQDLNIFIMSPQNTFIERIDAKTAQIQGNKLELEGGWETLAGKASVPFMRKSIVTSLDGEKIRNMKEGRDTFSFWQLPSYIVLLESSGLQSIKQKMYWHYLFSSAFWGAMMILLAAAFSCRPHRQGKATLLIFIGVLSGFFLYFFKDVTFALGSSGGLPPLIAAWLPPLLTFMVGAVLIFNQEDG